MGMGPSRKPVIVRKFSRDWVAGYAAAIFGQDASSLELLDLGGKVVTIGWETVKWVCYVRDFPAGEQANPERLLQRRFTVRPRAAGLWLRMTRPPGYWAVTVAGLAAASVAVGAASGQRWGRAAGGKRAALPLLAAGALAAVSALAVLVLLLAASPEAICISRSRP